MLTLNDGRAELWQWDTGRTLAVDADCSQVHFSNKVFGRSIDVDVIDGAAIIPDVLLQTDKDLNVWAFVGTSENGYTKISKTFTVNRRNKPADYVFTPTDQITLQTIQRQIGDISDLTTEAKGNLVAAINEAAASGGSGSMDLRVADGYIQYSTDSGSTWQNLIAVAELKGADGSKGDPGAPGKDGHSPVVTATKSGKTTTISVDGTAIATVEDGADGAPGKDGADGKPGAAGADGAKGADGITPTIGQNGNWFLGEEDTGKPSRGADGATGATGATGQKGADGKSAYQYAQDGGYTGTEEEFAAKMAEEIPGKLPNPNALTFTGAVTGSYDGSAPLSVDIPSGGDSGGGTLEQILDFTTTEEAAYIYHEIEPAITVKELLILINAKSPSLLANAGAAIVSARLNVNDPTNQWLPGGVQLENLSRMLIAGTTRVGFYRIENFADGAIVTAASQEISTSGVPTIVSSDISTISNIRVDTQNWTNNFAAGSRIIIYGVMAHEN